MSTDFFASMIRALPSAATNQYSCVAYVATLVAWVAIAWRVKRHAQLTNAIKELPSADRLTALRDEMGVVPVKDGLSAEQYLRSRIHFFLLVAFSLLCATAIFVVLIAAFSPENGKVTGSVSLY